MPGVPFDDERSTIRNREGRVLDEGGECVPGVYCTGWIKRGPTGIIGTNKKDATETVERLLEDARAGTLEKVDERSADDVDAALAARGCAVVSYSGWEAIDRVECGRGEEQGRPRVKLVSWEDLLSTALHRVT